MWMGVLALTAAVAAPALPARAEEDKAPQPYVVVIGVSNYEDKQIKPRPHAEDDAKSLYDLFTDKQYLGADAEHTRLLLGVEDAKRGSQPATRENILKALKWVAEKARAVDPVYIVFLGEGGSLGDLGDRHCYFAKDSTFKEREKNAIAGNEVAEALKGLKSQKVAAFLDVNFKGYDPPANTTVPEASFADKPFAEFRGDLGEEQERTPGRVVLLANRPTSASLDDAEHGIFAEALLEGLKGAADKDGYEPDGLVTVDELFEYMDKHVHELAVKLGKTDKDKEQVAIVLGSPNSHFVLTHNPDAFAQAQKRLASFEQLVKDKVVAGEAADEGRQFLARMPKLESQKALRKLYQQLTDDKIKADAFLAERAKVLEGTKLDKAVAAKFAERVYKAEEILEDRYYKEVHPAELTVTSIRKLFHALEEKVPEALEARLKKAKDLDGPGLKELLVDARLALGKREDLDKDKDLDLALVEMMRTLDPYTTYIDRETLDRFEKEVQGTFTGIGIQIRKDSTTDYLLVVTPIRGSPAYKTGIQTGDLITTIIRDVDSDGKALSPPDVVPTKGLTTNDAVKKILGQADTKVKLKVQREGEDKPLEFEITRGQIEVETVFGVKRNADDAWDFMLDPDKKIAYIRLSQFQQKSFADLEAAMSDLVKKQGVKGVVLDLRFNPGGLLESAVKISDLFIDDGLIVKIHPRVGRDEVHTGQHAGSLLGFPMVVLVNGESASASEIVSACLQDHSRAWVLGERSYGKGSVQRILDFADHTKIKLTMATYWRPSGKNINKRDTKGRPEDEWGVTPDKTVAVSEKDRGELFDHLRNNEVIPRKGKPAKTTDKPEFKDVQLEAALDYLTEQIKTASNNPIKKAG
jgi:C-terminal peptidase prc